MKERSCTTEMADFEPNINSSKCISFVPLLDTKCNWNVHKMFGTSPGHLLSERHKYVQFLSCAQRGHDFDLFNDMKNSQ